MHVDFLLLLLAFYHSYHMESFAVVRARWVMPDGWDMLWSPEARSSFYLHVPSGKSLPELA